MSSVITHPRYDTREKQIVHAFIDELTKRHNPDAWRMYCTDDFRHHFNLPDVPPTLAGIEALSQGILTAFPDVQVQIDLLLQEGDWIVERATALGTHTGAFMGISPSGRSFQWTETHLYRLRTDKIVEYIPGVRLEMLLARMAGRQTYFHAPTQSILSHAIALGMSGLSRLYRSRPDRLLMDNEQRERNRAVIARYIDEFKNQQRFIVFPQLFEASFRHHFDFEKRPNTMATFVSVGQNFLTAFPDVHVDVQQLITDGDYVVERNQVTATHQGMFAGVSATGKPVQWAETHIYRLQNGKIVENWPQVNFERILVQIQT